MTQEEMDAPINAILLAANVLIALVALAIL
jgi:hypothetical protein